MKKNYWKEKNVLVTGINGFIGGNLAKHLLARGANVTGLMRNDKKDSYLYFENLARRINLVQGDLVDEGLLKRVVAEEQIHCVFHLAAQVEVGVARAYPYLTWETNIRGTYSLLEAIRQNRETVEAVVIASSDKAYGSYPKEKMPYREDYPLIPVFPYDVSKACADMVARAYASPLYSLPLVVTRFCNIYGPGQLNFSALIPDAIRSALGYTEFIPRGNGMQVRDYIYAGDVAGLYMVIAEQLSQRKHIAGEVFNAGTNNPRRVKDIVKKVYSLLGNKKAYEKIERLFAGRKTVGEIDVQYMHFDKVKKYFGWSPRTNFDAGLKETIRWFKQYLKERHKSA